MKLSIPINVREVTYNFRGDDFQSQTASITIAVENDSGVILAAINEKINKLLV